MARNNWRNPVRRVVPRKRRSRWRERKNCINFDLCTQAPRRHTNPNLSQLILWIIRFNITSLAYKVPNILHLLNAKSIHTHTHSTLDTRAKQSPFFASRKWTMCVLAPKNDVPNDCRYVFTYVPKLKPIVRVMLSRSAIIFMANDERRRSKKKITKFFSLAFLTLDSLRFRFGWKIWFIHRLKHWSSNRFVSLCASSSHHFVEQHFPFRLCSFLLLLLLRCLVCWLSFVAGFRLYRNSILSQCSHHRRSLPLPRHFRADERYTIKFLE